MTDAIICAAILRHLNQNAKPGPHFFATQDAKDFGAIDIIEKFRSHDCTIIYTFEECMQRLRINPPASP